MKWLTKKRSAVIRRWKANQISLVDAAQELVRLGIPPLEAWRILEQA